VVPRFHTLDVLYRQGDGPALRAVVVCHKPSSLFARAAKVQQLLARKVSDGLQS
jgi:hypothetical protein